MMKAAYGAHRYRQGAGWDMIAINGFLMCGVEAYRWRSRASPINLLHQFVVTLSTGTYRYVFGTNIQAGRLVLDLADMHQRTTQSYVRRPYGVGMLVAAYDQTGPHLFQTCPSGNYFEYVAMAIGARSQSAKTYLEKHFEEFEVCGEPCVAVSTLVRLRTEGAGWETM